MLESAGDYVNLKLVSGRTVMFIGALSKLEQKLPAQFLRVHRSYIVNADLIAALSHRPGGTGVLALKSGGTVPVSRRTMPSVKDSLDVTL